MCPGYTQTNRRTDRRYQVHYLPRFAVDNYNLDHHYISTFWSTSINVDQPLIIKVDELWWTQNVYSDISEHVEMQALTSLHSIGIEWIQSAVSEGVFVLLHDAVANRQSLREVEEGLGRPPSQTALDWLMLCTVFMSKLHSGAASPILPQLCNPDHSASAACDVTRT